MEDIHTYYAGTQPTLVHNCPADLGNSGESVKKVPFNQMNKAIERGQAPKGIFRIDKGKIEGAEQPHAAFGKGEGAPSLNIDGTWKHGYVDVTRKQRDWLAGYGWKFD